MQLRPGVSSRRVRLTSAHLALRDNAQPLYGDSFAYGPILVPDREKLAKSGAQVLGELVSSWQVNAPGLVLKECGRGAAGNGDKSTRGANDYAVVFSAAMPLPSSLLRSLARYGGCNVWVNDDVVVSADDTMVSLHSARGGKYSVQLPRRVREVRDAVSGKVVARDAQTLRVKLSPPETRIYLFR
jgi:hypothetical protein